MPGAVALLAVLLTGGIRLGKPAEQINVGNMIRHTEEGFDLVECGG